MRERVSPSGCIRRGCQKIKKTCNAIAGLFYDLETASRGSRRRLFFRGFAPTRFDLSTQVREQPAGDGLGPVRRVRRKFALVREMDNDGARHHAISAGIVHAVQFHAECVGSFIFRESQSKSGISKTRHYRYDFAEVQKDMQFVAY
ncbi:hypothetical protein [Paraburkholderia atlantica]|uniref:hypothetical protein n=1 Tax=Paraburkholderia atlantica TaxID=2654982 RepID=UPI0012FF487B|nr:hypothetical protein [Paraburkholderia atlantica]